MSLENIEILYTKIMKNIAIIWAWAAGLMAAATILESLDSVSKESARKGGNFAPEKNPQSLRDSSFAKELIHIHLFEKNTSPWKKVIISGGGRCNVTTGITDKKILASRYTRGWDFIESAMGKLSPKKCREWFESHGVPLKCEEDMRIFPVSDDGHDIVWVYDRIFAKYRDKISLHYGESVTEVSTSSSDSVIARSHSVPVDDDAAIQVPKDGLLSSFAVLRRTDRTSQWRKQEKYNITTPKWSYETDILVITTGWNAYSHTGSTWDGYAFARSLGHTVTPLGPSLSSFLTSETWLHALSWLAFEDARVSFSLSSRRDPFLSQKWANNSHNLVSIWESDSSVPLRNDKIEQQILTWPLLLTHFGISWPLTFKASSHLAFEDIGKWKTQNILLSPLADMGRESWEAYLKDTFARYPKKLITSILSEKLPRRFAEAFVAEYCSHIATTFAGSISKSDREKISRLLGDGIRLTLLERRPGDEFVTAGWVSTDELDPETMESRIQSGLYFAGEILDVDGYTWGYSLQICWASGYSAGESITLS